MFHAKYASDDIYVTFTAEPEYSDYGVKGSPVMCDPKLDTIEIASLAILGVDVDPKAIPANLRDAIYSLTDEVEWERE